jgi:hypothetical protein
MRSSGKPCRLDRRRCGGGEPWLLLADPANLSAAVQHRGAGGQRGLVSAGAGARGWMPGLAIRVPTRVLCPGDRLGAIG